MTIGKSIMIKSKLNFYASFPNYYTLHINEILRTLYIPIYTVKVELISYQFHDCPNQLKSKLVCRAHHSSLQI